MIKYLYRHNKDYSRFNIIKSLSKDIKVKNDIFILLPFSKNQFVKNFLKRDKIINDFFISNYDTYVYDRKKISKKNPRAWWKYLQDWVNFRFSKYLLSDTNEHFIYWEELFGKFNGKHLVLPVLADKNIYYPNKDYVIKKKIEILFYGSFIPLHGIDIILKALKILEKNNLSFKAKIIGNGQMFDQMFNLYESLDLKNVQMDGLLISEEELAQEIRESDIILGIFGKSKKAQSVVPNKTYQALACKKALVSMKSDAVNEFFNSEDLVTCDNTPDELANELQKLILNPDRIDFYANNGYTKFLKLYSETESKFKKFIDEIDQELGK